MGIFDKLFGRTKKTEQETEKVEMMNPNDIWFTTPTISNEFPQTIPLTQQTEFDIYIHEDDYRQNEFLNLSSLPLVEQEINAIKDVWENHSKKSDDYTLFKNCHVRNKIGSPNLKIDFSELKTILKSNTFGQVIINGEVLVNGFAIKTLNTTYFGTLNNDIVSELCIAEWNENTTNEILEINKAYNLIFANWFHSDIIKND
jgi:hypothetical protein